jgi:hypothetical protein
MITPLPEPDWKLLFFTLALKVKEIKYDKEYVYSRIDEADKIIEGVLLRPDWFDSAFDAKDGE